MATHKRQISIELSEADLDRLDRLAELRGESRSEVVCFMLGGSSHADDLAEELAGLAELERGEGVALTDVLSRAEEIVARAVSRRDGSRR